MSQYSTLSLPSTPLFSRVVRQQHRLDGLVEDVLEPLLRQRRALHVLDGLVLVCHRLPVRGGRGPHLVGRQLLPLLLVVPEVDLGADEDDRRPGAVVADLGKPLLLTILERGWAGYRVAEKEHILQGKGIILNGYILTLLMTHRLRVCQRPQPVKVHLPGRVPEAEIDGAAVDHDDGGVAVEYGGDVLAGEEVLRVAGQHARLADGAVANHHALDRTHALAELLAAD